MGKKKNIYEKVKDADAFFYKEVIDMEAPELEKKIVSLARYEEDLKEAKKDDMDLQSLEEQVRVARKTHTEPLKTNRLKRAMIFEILRSRES